MAVSSRGGLKNYKKKLNSKLTFRYRCGRTLLHYLHPMLTDLGNKKLEISICNIHILK